MTERRIPLTDEQFDRLWLEHETMETVSQVLADTVMIVAKEKAKKLKLFWESIRNLTGKDPANNSHTIDWVSREIIVKEKDHHATT